MESNEFSFEPSPISLRYDKRDAVARLFHLEDSQSLQTKRAAHLEIQKVPPHTPFISDSPESALSPDNDSRASASFPKIGQESFERLCNIPEKHTSPDWNDPPNSKAGQIQKQNSPHTRDDQSTMSPKKSPEEAKLISKGNSSDPFSYRSSEYIHLNEPHDFPFPTASPGKETCSNSSNNQFQFPNQVSKLRKCTNNNLGRAKKSPSSTKIVIVILCLSLLVSLYFALFGSPVSFRNFFNSLTDEKKEELSNELRMKYMSLPEAIEKPSLQTNFPHPLSGLSYSPEGSNEPICVFSKEGAIRDIALISTVTSKIRTYGTQCNQIEHILHAIKALGLDMSISMGVWLSDNKTQNLKQISEAKRVLLSSYIIPIKSILIGNEALKRGDLSENSLISFIQEMKQFTSAAGLNVSVGTSESPIFISKDLVDSCDVIGFTIQPFLAGIPASEAAKWSLEQFTGLKKQYHNGKTRFVITELGWPFEGGYFKKAEASQVEYQIFMHSWIEETSKKILDDWYLFEAFNEPWKVRYNTKPNRWEAEWGLFDDKKILRFDIEEPDDDDQS